jgi:DNA-binding MarR family transcriptional regulator
VTDVRPATESVGRDPQAGQCAAEKPSCAAAAKPSGRWLTAAEMDSWVNLAQMLMLLPAALDRQLREDAGIPHAYYQILAMLSAEPGRSMRMTDLARIVGSTTSRLSHAVASLEQRGWVRRQACPSDKRGQVACLTEAGTAALKEAAPGHVAEVRRLVFDHLTAEDVARLRDITAKLLPTLNQCG